MTRYIFGISSIVRIFQAKGRGTCDTGYRPTKTIKSLCPLCLCGESLPQTQSHYTTRDHTVATFARRHATLI